MTFFYFFFVQIVEKLEAVQCVCVCVSLQTCCSSLSERTVSSHSLLVRLGMSAVLSGCVVDIFFFYPFFSLLFFGVIWYLVCKWVLLCVTTALLQKKKKKNQQKKPTEGSLIVGARWPTSLPGTGYQHKQASENHGRWAVVFERGALCLCRVCSWLGGLCSSPSTPSG